MGVARRRNHTIRRPTGRADGGNRGGDPADDQGPACQTHKRDPRRGPAVLLVCFVPFTSLISFSRLGVWWSMGPAPRGIAGRLPSQPWLKCAGAWIAVGTQRVRRLEHPSIPVCRVVVAGWRMVGAEPISESTASMFGRPTTQLRIQ